MSVANEQRALDMRATALHLLEHALGEASIDRAFENHVNCDRGVLRVGEDLYDLESYSRVLVVSIGMAAQAMVSALQTQAGSRFEGIIAGSLEPVSQLHGFRYFQGGHPTPNEESVRAANDILRSLSAQNASSLLIFLLSGGGSSIVEKALDDDISLADLIRTYEVLVLSGAPIAEINAIRKHLSAIKGGRMAQAAYPAQQVSLMVSDVPDSAPDALASGPTMPDSSCVEACYSIAERYSMTGKFPAPVRKIFESHTLQETPKSDDQAFQRSRWWTVLSNKSLITAAGKEAFRHGFFVEVDSGCDDWDYSQAADYLLNRARELRRSSERICLISGGEVTVRVTGKGVGGRNQQFALACASKITGENITVLSSGSDGIDGNSPAAGAVVDGTTVARAKMRGLDAHAYLSSFNAYPFFDSLGDAIVTGPTRNNLRDLRVVLAY